MRKSSSEIPPFCPNPWCPFHHPHLLSTYRWFSHDGFHHTLAFGPVPRFLCRFCNSHFSSQTFRMDYYAKRPVSYSRIFTLLCSGCSLRSIARAFDLSCGSVTNRIHRLSRQCIALQSFLRSYPCGKPVIAQVPILSTLSYTILLLLQDGSRPFRAVSCVSTESQEELTTALAELCMEVKRTQKSVRMHPHILKMAGIADRSPYSFLGELAGSLAMYRDARHCYARNVSNAVERVFCYGFFHNYLKEKKLEDIRKCIGSTRKFLSQINLGPVMERLWRRDFHTPNKTSPEYLPAYTVAQAFPNSS